MLLGLSAAPASAQSLTPLYHYFSSCNNDNFYTTDHNELGNGGGCWSASNITAYVYNGQADGTIPLYRYRNTSTGEHVYSSDFNELGGGSGSWVYEGIQCYLLSTQVVGSVPLFRYYSSTTQRHLYTTNSNPGSIWQLEGVPGYVSPS